ncbi:MAG: hypothetical protein HOP29_01280 [Phycisphaerales bacterium]|nr:hypothetical protein [Phycisphaerales bacterium]
MSAVRTIALVKGSERFVFRYATGNETQVIDALAALATDRDSRFDWFDAAVLSYQMGRRLEMELDEAAR